jgi:SagB-type dehydrogenase family enzyme
MATATLSELYHESSKENDQIRMAPIISRADFKTLNSERRFFEACEKTQLPENIFEEKIPPSKTQDFLTLAKKRRSQREFSRTPMTLAQISYLIDASFAYAITDAEGFFTKAFPSAGQLFTAQLYLTIRYSNDLSPGIYAHCPHTHSLYKVAGKESAFCVDDTLFGAQAFANQSACTALITLSLWKTKTKYQERGYRYALLECGHAAQSLCLAGTALGLGSCCIGSFDDSKLNALLGLDGVQETICYAICLGR